MPQPQHLTPSFVRGLVELARLAHDLRPDRSYPREAGGAELSAWFGDVQRGAFYTRIEASISEIARRLQPSAQAELLALIYIGDGVQTSEDFGAARDLYARVKDTDERMMEFSLWDVRRKLPRGFAVVWPTEEPPARVDDE